MGNEGGNGVKGGEALRQATRAQKVAHVRRAGQSRRHTCHWPGCNRQVPPAKWGCKEHWFRLPKYLRDMIWNAYVPGQEERGLASADYLYAAERVRIWIMENG